MVNSMIQAENSRLFPVSFVAADFWKSYISWHKVSVYLNASFRDDLACQRHRKNWRNSEIFLNASHDIGQILLQIVTRVYFISNMG